MLHRCNERYSFPKYSVGVILYKALKHLEKYAGEAKPVA